MRGAAVLTVFAVAGCGSSSSESASSAKPHGVSARFVGRTVHGGRDSFTETVRGAFDWNARKGWAVRRYLGVETRFVQLGRLCYRRFPGEPWKRFKATDVDGLCDADVFRNPATADDLLRSVASDWEEIGPASVRGVPTTHYRGRLNLGAVKGPIDLWVDGDGVVRLETQRGEKPGDFRSTREYVDLGIHVRVQTPKVGATG